MTAEPLPPILLVGGGRMGAALMAGWRAGGLSAAVVVDPAPGAAALAGPDVTVVADAAAVPRDFAPAAVVLAVKPQAATEALPPYARHGGALFVSIMAGKTLAALAGLLGPGAAVVRAMPNTPAAIGQGVTVAIAGPKVSPDRKALAERLLAATGAFTWVADEALLDPVTAISGGGPAYVFLLAEELERAGLEQGLPPELARLMARQTVIGAAALLAAGDEDAAAMRRAVTSPAGTTERALAVLMAPDAWPQLMRRAIAAATARAKELSG